MDMINFEELYMKWRKPSGLSGVETEEIDKMILNFLMMGIVNYRKSLN